MQKANLSVIIAHIGSWLLFLSLPVVFISGQSENNKVSDIISLPFYWFCFAFFIAVFYLHTYFLFPNLYRQGKQLLYFASVALLFLLLLWLQPFDKLMSHWRVASSQQSNTYQPDRQEQSPPDGQFRDRNPPPPRNFNNDQPPPMQDGNSSYQPPARPDGMRPGNRNRVDIVSIFMFIVIITISISLDVSKRLRIAAEQAAKAETDKANAELFALKAQVNPHFLFNTLNNIYSLAVTGSENTAESIMKLSNIMRYVTDDAPEDFVPLQKEIDCIDDFIDLQRLRIGSKVKLDYVVTGDTESRSIAPFILLTFIENTFKYGVRNQTGSHITIRISVSDDGITLFAGNPLPEVSRTEERRGTGIANVKKRLNYLYPDRHVLSVFTSDGFFTVQLFIRDKK